MAALMEYYAVTLFQLGMAFIMTWWACKLIYTLVTGK
jgi:hypothetical protein